MKKNITIALYITSLCIPNLFAVSATKQTIIGDLQRSEESFSTTDSAKDLFVQSQKSGQWSTALTGVSEYTKKYAPKDPTLIKSMHTIVNNFNTATKGVREGYILFTNRGAFKQSKADALDKKLSTTIKNMDSVTKTLQKTKYLLSNKKNVRKLLVEAARFVKEFATNASQQLGTREFLRSQSHLESLSNQG